MVWPLCQRETKVKAQINCYWSINCHCYAEGSFVGLIHLSGTHKQWNSTTLMQPLGFCFCCGVPKKVSSVSSRWGEWDTSREEERERGRDYNLLSRLHRCWAMFSTSMLFGHLLPMMHCVLFHFLPLVNNLIHFHTSNELHQGWLGSEPRPLFSGGPEFKWLFTPCQLCRTMWENALGFI